MKGMVLAHHALLNIELRVPADDGFEIVDIKFVVDTGFVGDITLPLAVVQALGLAAIRATTANLADGSSISANIYEVEILWQESVRRVEVFAMGDVPLLGTLLLDGCELNIRFADHEVVAINPL